MFVIFTLLSYSQHEMQMTSLGRLSQLKCQLIRATLVIIFEHSYVHIILQNHFCNFFVSSILVHKSPHFFFKSKLGGKGAATPKSLIPNISLRKCSRCGRYGSRRVSALRYSRPHATARPPHAPSLRNSLARGGPYGRRTCGG